MADLVNVTSSSSFSVEAEDGGGNSSSNSSNSNDNVEGYFYQVRERGRREHRCLGKVVCLVLHIDASFITYAEK